MATNTRDIKRRIRSVSNIKKLTKAMELVSAAKMRKSVEKVLQTRSYAQIAWDTIKRFSRNIDSSSHALLQDREEIKKIAVVLISSNRGLCGAFNTSIIKHTKEYLKQEYPKDGGVDIDFLTLGTKGAQGMKQVKYHVEADFEKQDITSKLADIYPVAHMVVDGFMNGAYDKVYVAYTDYYSAINQQPNLVPLLPLKLDEPHEELGSTDDAPENADTLGIEDNGGRPYMLEPSKEELLGKLIPQIIDVKVYQAVLESEASEHSARMMAMKNAHDSASDMIDELTLMYNRARQASITQEISEISAGKAALETQN
jgi:F-type H+-transporting ATPase subunit gamma